MPFTKDTAGAAGRKGGKSTKKKYGSQFLAEIGKKGATRLWKKKRSEKKNKTSE